jgi:hypothetical protein
MLFREIIAVYTENSTKSYLGVSTFGEQSTELEVVKPGGRYI